VNALAAIDDGRHCEARSDEAIQAFVLTPDCFRRRPSGYDGPVASLALTRTDRWVRAAVGRLLYLPADLLKSRTIKAA
jgi:hypothetical protein